MNDTMNDAKDTTEIAEEMDTPTVLTLPLLAMRGIVLFPGMIMHFDLAREPFVKALKAGMESDRRVVLVTQKDPLIEEPKPDDLYTVGVIAEVRQILRAPDGVTRVLVEGKERVTITSAVLESDKKTSHFILMLNSNMHRKRRWTFPTRMKQPLFPDVLRTFFRNMQTCSLECRKNWQQLYSASRMTQRCSTRSCSTWLLTMWKSSACWKKTIGWNG